MANIHAREVSCLVPLGPIEQSTIRAQVAVKEVQLPVRLAANVAAEGVEQQARLALRHTAAFIKHWCACEGQQREGGGGRCSVHEHASSSLHSSQQKRGTNTVRHPRNLPSLPFPVQSLQLLQARGPQLRLVDEILLHLLQPLVRVGGLGLAPWLLPFAVFVLHLRGVVGGDLVHYEWVQRGAQGLEQRELEKVRVGSDGGHDLEARRQLRRGEGKAGDAVSGGGGR